MPLEDWRPTVEQVGAVLRARTKDRNNNELGTFTEATRPTAAQVETLIDEAQDLISADVGVDLIVDAQRWARAATTIQTAMLIEIGYFPEQINTGRSPYPQLERRLADLLKRTRVAIDEAEGETPEGTAARGPSYNFDENDPLISRKVGW